MTPKLSHNDQLYRHTLLYIYIKKEEEEEENYIFFGLTTCKTLYINQSTDHVLIYNCILSRRRKKSLIFFTQTNLQIKSTVDFFYSVIVRYLFLFLFFSYSK